MKTSLFPLLLFLSILPLAACSKSYTKCQAQTKPGTESAPCEGPHGPVVADDSSNNATPDSQSIVVTPWVCEGRASPWCHQGSDTIFTKVYPKLDKTTCEILDNTKSREAPVEKCEISPADLKDVQNFLPKGLEILGILKGFADDRKPIYRVTYRSSFDSVVQIFDAKGNFLPSDTPMTPDEWISKKLREKFLDKEFDAKEKRFLGVLKSGLSQKEIKANRSQLSMILAPIISREDREQLIGGELSSFEFTSSYGKLKTVLPTLKAYLSLLDLAPVACPEGFPVFCRKQADGSFKFDDPIRIETDECPIYKAPPDAVDSSFCEG